MVVAADTGLAGKEVVNVATATADNTPKAKDDLKLQSASSSTDTSTVLITEDEGAPLDDIDEDYPEEEKEEEAPLPEEEDVPGASPKTGDDVPIRSFVLVMLAALVALAIATRLRCKANEARIGRP